ncbi:Na+/H+ antiporter NhaA [Caballeronia sp. LZ032]|uniref:Na+/H+ antiporter NhaA n=1 Tax=Caballeronia sp. LZ032 TaxID=3038565 RepID=UPI0028640E30|nr:Na+/H+ antiporter NhaA [Caballeronia sp. LZ032]MDR5883800.1 Na+/H+ antiporter NhaA [Caballeronia sp. LZ032]
MLQQSARQFRHIARKARTALEHFLQIEAASGIILLICAAAALFWANSPFGEAYHHLWEAPVAFKVGSFEFSRSLHFWINDGLMTAFFLVVGIEIRREMHEGSLSEVGQAVLPLAAAVGGVVGPALIYVAINYPSGEIRGWAVPTATDIAFAVGVLALLGRSIPGNLRIFLLTLAIVDDIIAVLVIACFYSSGLNYAGFGVAAIGVAMVLIMQRVSIGSAPAYMVPGAIIWAGLLVSGAHPTLAGVVLGLMTPVMPTLRRERALVEMSQATGNMAQQDAASDKTDGLAKPLQVLRQAQREMLAPVVRVQWSLHPWVAYGIMPLFALANAGVSFSGLSLTGGQAQYVLIGIITALVLGKPIGVFLATWALVKTGMCRLPAGVTWSGIALVALLAGIGFTMSIFISMLAFHDPQLLSVSKLAVLIGSVTAGALGLGWGVIHTRRAAAA